MSQEPVLHLVHEPAHRSPGYVIAMFGAHFPRLWSAATAGVHRSTTCAGDIGFWPRKAHTDTATGNDRRDE